MSTIQIRGLRPLSGEIEIQGSKNAVLPMMAASVLHKGITVLTNVPRIQDVFCMMGILNYMGCTCRLDDHELTIDAGVLTHTKIPEQDVRCMRSSIMVLGALLGRMGEATTHYPGGCSIGKRPIDLHLYALRKLGAVITEEKELISARAVKLSGTSMKLPFPSVGATENALLAAIRAEGFTVIDGAAREPEIEELCCFLNTMGAEISGMRTGCLCVRGVQELHDSKYQVPGDRIVAGTYLTAAMTGTGRVCLNGINPEHLSAVQIQLEKAGARMESGKNSLSLTMNNRPLAMNLMTEPYPGFPTDMQSPLMSVLAIALGQSQIEETIFEGRFKTAKELQKMGAEIRIVGAKAYLNGRYPLIGTDVKAPDLRGGAALVVAGLAAEGETRIFQCFHILRGYEDICRDLRGIGADVTYET